MFNPVNSKLDVTSMEEGVLKFWKQANIFKKTVTERQGGPDSADALAVAICHAFHMQSAGRLQAALRAAG